MITFEEELKKFHPSLEVEQAEEAIYNQDLTDVADLLVKMVKEAEEKEDKQQEGKMFCYHCGCHLSEHDFCTACGADVSLYKKIMYVSNRFYNEGLEKAGVRDLTGAINSLRQSLKFNKNKLNSLTQLYFFILKFIFKSVLSFTHFMQYNNEICEKFLQ